MSNNQFIGLKMDWSGKVVCDFCQSATPGGPGTGVATCCRNRENFLRDELARPKFKFERTTMRSCGQLSMTVSGKLERMCYVDREVIRHGFLGLLGYLESWEQAVARTKQLMLDEYYEKLRLERDLSDA